MSELLDTSTLISQRTDRLRAALAAAPYDAFLAVSTANVLYATGYRSMGASVFGRPTIGALVTGDRTVVAAPVADSGPATDSIISPDDFIPYGRFYFESTQPLSAAFASDANADLVDALRHAAAALGLKSATIGVDKPAIDPNVLARLSLALPGVRFVDASGWALKVRSRKLSGEIESLERAARLAEDGVSAAIDAAGVGISEKELAGIVNRVISTGGGEPRFTVASSGPNSAFADVYPTDRALAPGDLLRFDVGCVIDGYWSDIGRTAVVGEPSAEQRARYEAILGGVDRQLELARPGVAAATLFGEAMSTVQGPAIPSYRRQHCGHGIGLDVYEPPIINESTDETLEVGMTFCFETPHYQIGGGGMMVEDTLVITDGGYRRFTITDRKLRVIPA